MLKEEYGPTRFKLYESFEKLKDALNRDNYVRERVKRHVSSYTCDFITEKVSTSNHCTEVLRDLDIDVCMGMNELYRWMALDDAG